MGRKASFNFSMSSRSPEEQAAIKAKLAAINSKFSGKVSTTENVNRQINVKLGLGTSSASASNRESSEYFKDGSPKRDMMSPRRDNTPGSNQNTSGVMAKKQDATHIMNLKRSSDTRASQPATTQSAGSIDSAAKLMMEGTREKNDQIAANAARIDEGLSAKAKLKEQRRREAQSKSSGGGDGGQPRVPAGSPDGGQWTK